MKRKWEYPQQHEVKEGQCSNCLNLNPGEFIDDEHTGDRICTRCGMVQRKLLCDTAEWRDFSDEVDTGIGSRSRVGSASSIYAGSSTLGSAVGTGGDGRRLAARMTVAAKSKYGDRKPKGAAQDSSEVAAAVRCVLNIFDLTDTPVDTVAHEMTERLQRTLEHTSLPKPRGIPMNAFGAAIVYVACKLEGAPRLFKEFVRETGQTLKKITAAYKFLRDVLPDSLLKTSIVNPSSTNDLVEGVIARMCSALKFDRVLAQKAQRYVPAVLGLFEGRRPETIAAVTLYSALPGTGKDQKDYVDTIAGMCDITSATIHSLHATIMAEGRRQQAQKEGPTRAIRAQ